MCVGPTKPKPCEDSLQFEMERRWRRITQQLNEKRRWTRFIKQLNEVHEGQVGWQLRSLVIVERDTLQIPARYIRSSRRIRFSFNQLLVFEETVSALTMLVKPFEDRVRNLTIEIRSAYDWTPFVPVRHHPYRVLSSAVVSSR